jgi:tetratricopeptide (TPR) repeat protein
MDTDGQHQPAWQSCTIQHEVIAGNGLSFVSRCNEYAMVQVQTADERHILVHHRTSSNDAQLHEASNQISQALLALEARSSINCVKSNRPDLIDSLLDDTWLVSSLSASFPHSGMTEHITSSDKTNTNEKHALPSQEQPEYDEGMHCFQQLLPIDVDGPIPAVPPILDKSLGSVEPQSLWTMARPSQPVQSNALNRSLASILMYNMGQIRKRQMRHGEAYSCFTESYRLIVSSTELSKTSSMIVRILHNLGYIQYRNGNVEASLEMFKIALQVLNGCTSTPESERTSILPAVVRNATMAATLNCLGVLYFHLPRLSIEQSTDFLLKSLSLQQAILRDVNTETMNWRGIISVSTLVPSTLNNIGRVHFLNGKNDLAIQVSNESLRMRRQLLGNDHLDVAATIFNLAHTHYEIQDYDAALSHCQEFLRIARPQLSIRHRDVAYVLKCIAYIHHQQKNYIPAIAAYHEALTACDAVFGLHSEVASICNKLGNLYYTINKYDFALSMYESGLQIEKEVFQPYHLNIAITLCNIAQIHKVKGNIEESLRLYGQVYVIQVASVGCADPIVAVTLSNIAFLQYQCHHYKSAYETYQEVLRIRRTAFGENDLHVAATLNSMGLVLYKLGEFEMALQNFMSSYEIRQNELGDSHSDVAVNLHNIATILITLGNDDIAMQFYQEAVRVEQNIFGPDHVDTIPTLLYLASLHKRNGEITGAISYLQEVLRIQLNNHRDNMETSGEQCESTASYEAHPDNRNEEANGSSKKVVVDDVIKTLHKLAKLHLQIGNVGEYVDTMSNAWRWSSMSDDDKIQQFTIRRGWADASDDDDDYSVDDSEQNVTISSNVFASRITHTPTTRTSITTYDLYVISKLHPEMASTA